MQRTSRGVRLPPVIMPTDLTRVPDPLSAMRRLPPASAVILRDRGHPDRAGWARLLREATADLGHLLLVANDPDLADAVAADGVHLSEAEVGALPFFGLATAACHSLPALRRAARTGVSAGILSPVFPTASHPGARVLGLHRARSLAAATPLPVYAMGGIDARSARSLGGVFAGFAAISAFG